MSQASTFTVARRLGIAAILLHLVQIAFIGGMGPGRRICDVLELFTAVLAAVECWRAAFRTKKPPHVFWLILGAALAGQAIADANWIYFQDWLGVGAATSLVTRNLVLVRTWFLTVLVMRDPESAVLGWGTLLDAIQVGIVYALSFLLSSYNTQILSSSHADFWIGALPRLILLPIALFRALRVKRWSTAGLETGLMLYLAFYLFAEAPATLYLAYTNKPTGSWLDLVWTVSPVAVAWWASGWKDADASATSYTRSLADLVVLNAPFALMPLVAVLQALSLRDQYPVMRFSLLAASFLVFGARLARSELQQARQFRSLQSHALEVQKAHESLSEQRLLLQQSLTAARERAAQFRAVLDNSRDAILFCDAKGTIIYRSQSSNWLTGYTDEERVGQDGLGVIHPDDAQLVRQIWTDIVAQPDSVREFEFRMRHKEGSWLTIDASGKNLLQNRDVQAVVLTLRDVTAQKQAERERAELESQLIQAQKMESLGRLAGGIAHDFNNLLTVIGGYAGLIFSQLPSGDQRRSGIERVIKASEQASGLTRQLLAFSRQQILEPTRFDISVAVQEMSKMLGTLVGDAVELRLRLHPEPVVVDADRNQFGQVLMNLAINARDAMPAGGRLVIETSISRDGQFGASRPGGYAVLTVEDTGTGIDAATRSRIFEPFFTTKEPGKGTGLGLSMVAGFVTQSEGFVDVDSQMGRGTIFRICLPAVCDVPDRSSETKALRVSRTGGRVLVVDDRPDVRDFVTDVLRANEYEVIAASGIVDAIALCSEGETVDLVVTDVEMPDGSGLELAAQLHAMHPGIRVLFMSGHSERFHPGDGDFIQKPFSPAELIDRIEGVLSR
jgi:PAS domain S-box-containing protein